MQAVVSATVLLILECCSYVQYCINSCIPAWRTVQPLFFPRSLLKLVVHCRMLALASLTCK